MDGKSRKRLVALVARHPHGVRLAGGAMLIILAFSLFQALTYRDVVPSNDTYQYARQTLRILGYSQPAADHDSVVMFCQDIAQSPKLERKLEAKTDLSGYSACLYAYRDGMTPSSPRYIAIFTSRPGYPLASALPVEVFGLRAGLWLTAMFFDLVGSLLVLALLRAAKCAVLWSLAGQALFLVLPTGYWGSRMLTDSPSMAATLAALLGAWWLTRGRIRSGSAVFCAAVVAGFLVRYSSQQAITLALGVGALILLGLVPAARHRGTVVLAALAAAATAASMLCSTLLGWPGFSESLQDTFTNHFEFPDVSHPLGELMNADGTVWGQFADSVLTLPLLVLPAALIVITVLLWRRDPVYAVLVAVTASTGFAAVLAHPILSQAQRLIAPAWLIIALGLPVLLTARAGVRAGATERAADRISLTTGGI